MYICKCAYKFVTFIRDRKCINESLSFKLTTKISLTRISPLLYKKFHSFANSRFDVSNLVLRKFYAPLCLRRHCTYSIVPLHMIKRRARVRFFIYVARVRVDPSHTMVMKFAKISLHIHSKNLGLICGFANRLIDNCRYLYFGSPMSSFSFCNSMRTKYVNAWNTRQEIV